MILETHLLRIRLFAFSFFFLVTISLPAQSPRDRQLEETATSAFEEGHYKEALSGFNELLGRYPRDPMYNYYVGVCLTSLGQEPEHATASLRLASLSKVPGDVFFFLGRATYQLDEYAEALKYFERFRESSDARTRNRYHVDRWINVCRMYMRNPQHTIDTAGLSASYQTTLDAALTYQHGLDSIRYLIKKEEQISGADTDKKDRLAVLNEEEKYYEALVAGYFSSARKMERSGMINAGTGQGDRKTGNPYTANNNNIGGSPYLEQMKDRFYKDPGVSVIFDKPDRERLDQLMEVTSHGNTLMDEAQQINNEIEKYKVVANAAQRKREVQQAGRNIQQLENKKMEKRMEAIGIYRKANDEQYALYNKYLDKLIQPERNDDAVIAQAKVFRDEAIKSHRKVLSLREEAGKEQNEEKKYDKLMEANAYELISLDNQKKAIGTLTGMVPLAGRNVDVTHPPVSAVPKTTAVRETDQGGKPGGKQRTEVAQGNQEGVDNSNSVKKNEVVKQVVANVPPESNKNTRIEQLNRFPYGFTVHSQSPYNQFNPIPEMEGLPEGVNYKIQVAAFSQQPDLDFFKGIYPMSREDIPGKNLVRYYTGLFRTYNNALKALLQVRKMGFPDALIVGFYNGERSSLERIRWLEDDLPFDNVSGGNIVSPPSASPANLSSGNDGDKGLVYRVQIGAFRKPLSEKKLEQFRQFTNGKAMKITQTDKGIYIYSIGNFLTFEEAVSFKSTLLKEGVKGAFVTAWENGVRKPIKEIR